MQQSVDHLVTKHLNDAYVWHTFNCCMYKETSPTSSLSVIVQRPTTRIFMILKTLSFASGHKDMSGQFLNLGVYWVDPGSVRHHVVITFCTKGSVKGSVKAYFLYFKVCLLTQVCGQTCRHTVLAKSRTLGKGWLWACA